CGGGREMITEPRADDVADRGRSVARRWENPYLAVGANLDLRGGKVGGPRTAGQRGSLGEALIVADVRLADEVRGARRDRFAGVARVGIGDCYVLLRVPIEVFDLYRARREAHRYRLRGRRQGAGQERGSQDSCAAVARVHRGSIVLRSV